MGKIFSENLPCRRILHVKNCIEWSQKMIAGTLHTLNRCLAHLTTMAYCSNRYFFSWEPCSMHSTESQNEFYSCRVWNWFFKNSWFPGICKCYKFFSGHLFNGLLFGIEFPCICEKIVKRERGGGGEGWKGGRSMDQISIKTPNPKCRLYWC